MANRHPNVIAGIGGTGSYGAELVRTLAQAVARRSAQARRGPLPGTCMMNRPSSLSRTGLTRDAVFHPRCENWLSER